MKLKVAINTCHGGFGLSLEASRRLYELGEPPTWEYYPQYLEKEKLAEKSKEWYLYRYSDISRTNPNLIKVIEELGSRANGMCSELAIVEIDVDDLVGSLLSEHDGYESLELPGAKTVFRADDDWEPGDG